MILRAPCLPPYHTRVPETLAEVVQILEGELGEIPKSLSLGVITVWEICNTCCQSNIRE